jgi:hypothetical protein
MLGKSNVNLTRTRILFGICILSLILLFIYSILQLQSVGLSPSRKDQDLELRYIEPATNRSSRRDGAFVFLALGAQANQMNCPAAIESLVRLGGWDGQVYLLTDKPDCFNDQDIRTAADLPRGSDKLKIVSVAQHFDDLNLVSGDLRRNRKKSLKVKTQLFRYITDPSVNVLAYADCDILFG